MEGGRKAHRADVNWLELGDMKGRVDAQGSGEFEFYHKGIDDALYGEVAQITGGEFLGLILQVNVFGFTATPFDLAGSWVLRFYAGQPGDSCIQWSEAGQNGLLYTSCSSGGGELDRGECNVIFLAGEQGRLITQGALKW